ncbi:hypothetical protein EFS18_01270 [Levilactobacillus brevis]|nr:hypothetical protein [Levilactobacillus brevis]
MVNTILKEADLFCPNSVRINFTIYHSVKSFLVLREGFFIGRMCRFFKINEHTQFAEGNLLSTSYFLIIVKVETDFIKKEWES